MVDFDYIVDLRPLTQAEGSGYLAAVPALPGCQGDGATPEEALADVAHAISEWIAACETLGRPVPKPEKWAT